jgi:hypothetical protein
MFVGWVASHCRENGAQAGNAQAADAFPDPATHPFSQNCEKMKLCWFGAQVSRAFPLHCSCPGAQAAGMQPVFWTQPYEQLWRTVVERPSAEHWTGVFPLQEMLLGVQIPGAHCAASEPEAPGFTTQTPRPFVTQDSVIQPVPRALHRSTDFPSVLHWTLPGVQVAGTHSPFMQPAAHEVTKVWTVPVGSHSSTVSPLHSSAPGAQLVLSQNATICCPVRPFVAH